MAFNAADALRAAGIIGSQDSAQLEEFCKTLTEQETQVLISTRDRLLSFFPDVVAHSQDWATPEAAKQGFDAAMLCACGLWSGSGEAN